MHLQHRFTIYGNGLIRCTFSFSHPDHHLHYHQRYDNMIYYTTWTYIIRYRTASGLQIQQQTNGATWYSTHMHPSEKINDANFSTFHNSRASEKRSISFSCAFIFHRLHTLNILYPVLSTINVTIYCQRKSNFSLLLFFVSTDANTSHIKIQR